MKCPNCQTTLLITDKSGIEIDYCPDCRGIWLDKGELEKITERTAEHYSKKENYDSDSKKYESNKYDDNYYRANPHKKRKSFLGDIFDF